MKREIRRLIQKGCHVNYKDLSICYLADFKFNEVVLRNVYQVDCPYKPMFSEVYLDLDEAIDKFLEIKKKKTKTSFRNRGKR